MENQSVLVVQNLCMIGDAGGSTDLRAAKCRNSSMCLHSNPCEWRAGSIAGNKLHTCRLCHVPEREYLWAAGLTTHRDLHAREHRIPTARRVAKAARR